MVLDGFWKEMRAVWMEKGQGTCQVVGCNGHAPANHMPPAPSADVSQKLMYPGLSVTSLQQ